MKEKMSYTRSNDDGSERRTHEIDPRDLGLKAGAKILSLSETAVQLTDDHHGKILDFLAATAVTVTIPNTLRIDFYCGLSQGGIGQVNVVAGSGATLVEADSRFKTEKRYVILSLIAFTEDTFRLFGRTAA
jgi:hypothetical protein